MNPTGDNVNRAFRNHISKWRVIKSEMVFERRWYRVRQETVEIEPGKIIDDYFLGVFNNIVLVIALTEDGRVPLVRQYKHGAGEILYELPAGYIDDNESPLAAAKRELREETGFSAKEWKKLGFFYSNSTKESGNGLYIFRAKNAIKLDKQTLDGNEKIQVRLFEPDKLVQMARCNKIRVAGSALAVLLAMK